MNIHQTDHILKDADPAFTSGAKELLLKDKKATGS